MQVEKVENCSCYETEDIVTPIDVNVLQELLTEANYDIQKSSKLIQGFKSGFDLGYRGNMKRRNMSCNLPFKVGDESEMWEKIMKEVKLNRYAGPYSEQDIPYSHFVQSLIGLVPKSGNKTRLIFHLSYDFGEEKSINTNTPDEMCSVKYKDLDFAIKGSLKLLEHLDYQIIYYAKTDLVSAF